jgi:hypothetical protein
VQTPPRPWRTSNSGVTTHATSTVLSVDWALLAVSAALLFATVAYVVYTARMADEMQKTRLMSIKPVLSLDVGPRSHQHGELVLTNVGQGTALNVELTITFEPSNKVRQWQAYSLAPGKSAHFIPASLTQNEDEYPTFQDLADANASVRVTGTMRDTEAGEHEIDERVGFSSWWVAQVGAHLRLPRESGEKIASELEKIRKALERRQ